MSGFEELKSLTERMFRADPVEHHPLFVALEHDRLPEPEAQRIALQIFHVVEHFPRLIAAMLSNLSDWRARLPLVENLFCEHGRMNPTLVHVETYRTFLRGLGVDDAAVANSTPAIATVVYNRAVLDLCLHHPAGEALAALGVIEETVARVSPIVGRWGARHRCQHVEDACGHFADHQVLDLRHADEIYALAAELFAAATRPLVEHGLRLGMYYQRRLYTDLVSAAHTAPAGG